MLVLYIKCTNGKNAAITDIVEDLLTSPKFKELLIREVGDTEFGGMDFLSALRALEGETALKVSK